MHPNFASVLYGGTPVRAEGAPSKVVTAGAAVPSPDPSVAPAASAGVAGGDLFDDPTFWLVAVIGAVVGLASISK